MDFELDDVNDDKENHRRYEPDVKTLEPEIKTTTSTTTRVTSSAPIYDSNFAPQKLARQFGGKKNPERKEWQRRQRRQRRRADKNWRQKFENPIRRDPKCGSVRPEYQRRKGRNPGIDEELSPADLYPRPPSKTANNIFEKFKNPKLRSAANGSSGTGGSSSGDGSSGGSSSSGGGSNGNGGYLKIGGSSSDGLFGSGSGGKSSELDLDQFDYPDSPTSHKWLADNNDLSPLTVLDNINLKTEFPYASSGADLDKPPDINSITLDTGAEHLFQFAASVPDSSSTLLDIGTDSFSQSLYDDLGDINLADFPSVGAFASVQTSTMAPTLITTNISSNNVMTINNNNNYSTNSSNNNSNILSLLAAAQPVQTAMTAPSAIQTTLLSQLPVSAAGILQKPISIEKLTGVCSSSGNPVTITGNGFAPIQFSLKALDNRSTMDVGTINLAGLLPVARAVVAAAVVSESHPTPLPAALKTLEPLPASALKGLIKTEPSNQAFAGISMGIKTEDAVHPDFETSVFSPSSLYSASIASPGSPGSSPGGGKMKSSHHVRKKSTSSSSTADEDDISNIPSLQMRIQIISQRVSFLNKSAPNPASFCLFSFFSRDKIAQIYYL